MGQRTLENKLKFVNLHVQSLSSSTCKSLRKMFDIGIVLEKTKNQKKKVNKLKTWNLKELKLVNREWRFKLT